MTDEEVRRVTDTVQDIVHAFKRRVMAPVSSDRKVP
jgi:hypothetical protein